jgi:hypothetical protein
MNGAGRLLLSISLLVLLAGCECFAWPPVKGNMDEGVSSHLRRLDHQTSLDHHERWVGSAESGVGDQG